MIFAGWARRCAIGFLFCLGLSGCLPGADSQLDEKTEPHFIAGKNLVEQRDYQGAIDEFEKALEVNPRSASAHFELGWLCEQNEKVNDPAAAIYHYEQYMKYSANPEKAELVRQHINLCKLELARTVSATGTLAPPAQREFDRIVMENRDLQGQLAALQNQLAQMKSSAAALPKNPNANPPLARLPAAEAPRNDSPRIAAAPGSKTGVASARTYAIKTGDTIAAVARKYGVSLNALLAANPHVRPTHLSVGQVLNIPAP